MSKDCIKEDTLYLLGIGEQDINFTKEYLFVWYDTLFKDYPTIDEILQNYSPNNDFLTTLIQYMLLDIKNEILDILKNKISELKDQKLQKKCYQKFEEYKKTLPFVNATDSYFNIDWLDNINPKEIGNLTWSELEDFIFKLFLANVMTNVVVEDE